MGPGNQQTPFGHWLAHAQHALGLQPHSETLPRHPMKQYLIGAGPWNPHSLLSHLCYLAYLTESQNFCESLLNSCEWKAATWSDIDCQDSQLLGRIIWVGFPCLRMPEATALGFPCGQGKASLLGFWNSKLRDPETLHGAGILAFQTPGHCSKSASETAPSGFSAQESSCGAGKGILAGILANSFQRNKRS